MAIAVSLQRYFERKGVAFQTHQHVSETSLSKLCSEMGLDPAQIAVPVLLQSARKASLMAVMPLHHALDLERVAALLRRDFQYLDDAGISAWFQDVEPGAEPPIPEPYDLPCIVDRALMKVPRIFFRGGAHSCLVSVDSETFQQLMSAYPKAVISNGEGKAGTHRIRNTRPADPAMPEQIRACLEKAHRLPAMPVMAMKIIQLLHEPETTSTDLADAVELDPSMAAQIIRYASSPYFGYRGRIESVQDAISRVLGFDLVSNIALGIASTKAFSVPQDGPLGMKAFWKHALYSAVVCQSLARKINRPDVVNPATAYLCGLLHNIGILLMGHLFPPEFSLLNRRSIQHPETPLHALEKDMIGMGEARRIMALGHDQIGGCLLEQWRLPEPVVTCCYHHHDDRYTGPQADYVRLVQLGNRLLAQRRIGDLGVPENADLQFGAGLLSVGAAESVFEKVMEMCAEIDSLADHIAA